MAFSWPKIACCAFSHHKLAAGEGSGSSLPDSSSGCYQIQLPKAGNACAIKLGLTASCARCSVQLREGWLPPPPPQTLPLSSQGVKQEVVDKKGSHRGGVTPLRICDKTTMRATETETPNPK